MILLIDVGNTRLKWRCLHQGELYGGGQLAHQGNLTSEMFAQLWGSLGSPSSIWGVTVASSRIAEQISHYCATRWGLTAYYVAATKCLGRVTNGYSVPETLGPDRWMALIGADRIASGSCCVADCGSAVTVDCLNAAHEHIGGLILPGLKMMPQCVSRNTAQVTYKADEAAAWLGRDTASCLTSGATQSIVGMLQRTAEFMEKQFSAVTLIITGGDAPHLQPWLGKEWRFEPDLIFIGLAAVVQQHKG